MRLATGASVSSARLGPCACRCAAVSLEFAILALPLMILMLGTMELGYDYFVQAELDDAVNMAARGVQLGNQIDNTGAEKGSQFVQAAVCPDLGGMLNCNQLYVAVAPVTTDYYQYLLAHPPSLATATGTGGANADPVNTGASCQPMLVEAYYLGPTFVGALIPTFATKSPVNGTTVHVTYAAAGFVNENYNGAGGC